jgi:hypothetical protein
VAPPHRLASPQAEGRQPGVRGRLEWRRGPAIPIRARLGSGSPPGPAARPSRLWLVPRHGRLPGGGDARSDPDGPLSGESMCT